MQIEVLTERLLHGDGLATALGEFFAVRELGRVPGRERVAALFSRNRVEP